ncbi:MAG: hypothetical protein L3J54_02235 [Draconibacterium sp.]|nr:hypothetical protein [Draconibacterium sp.]
MTLTKEIDEIEFHQERIRLIPKLIEISNLINEYWDLYLKISPDANAHFIDIILESRHSYSELIKFFSREYNESVIFLESRGIDPLPISPEELKAFEKEFPGPYRWRIPAWVKEPLKKISNNI